MQGTFVRAFLALGLLAIAAPGATLWNATLNQAQEVPPSGSPATGTGMASYDPATTILTVMVDWTGLTTPAMMGHIHCCVPPGTNGPVAVPFPNLPAVESGSYSNAFDLSTASTFGAAFLSARGGDVSAARTDLLSAMDGGQAYFNLHTETFPA
ncbi:MAG: CHRD domain-containing protein, partial [Bryobacterales bacterium]|nr:CHRD domain-containing protein [Bryobacterales bacterium]